MTVLVTGGQGQLGRHLGAHNGVTALGRARLDVCVPDSIDTVFDTLKPHCVIHCAAMANVDACTRDPSRAYQVNAGGTENIARACADRRIPLLHISTDYVVGGPDQDGHRIAVDGPIRPQSVYARSKWAAEQAAQAHGGTIVRVQWVYSVEGSEFLGALQLGPSTGGKHGLYFASAGATLRDGIEHSLVGVACPALFDLADTVVARPSAAAVKSTIAEDDPDCHRAHGEGNEGECDEKRGHGTSEKER